MAQALGASGTDDPTSGLDATDTQLLRLLMEDGRQSHRELARRADVGLATVSRRMRQLEERGILKGTLPLLDADGVGWGLTVVVGLRIEKGHLRDVQQKIAQDPRVFAVYDITGEWDGLVLARLRDRDDLDDLAKTTLSLDHIMRTNTMVVLQTVHEDAIVRLPPS